MSRICYDGTGTDNTAALKTFLATTKNPMTRFLYLIGYPDDPSAVWLTDHEAPLTYTPLGVFRPAVIKKSSTTLKVGLDVQDCTVTWSPSNRVFTTSVATQSPLQRAANHGFDMQPVRIWKVYMPTPGDCNTIGVVEWFGGVVSTAKVTRSGIEFDVKSYMYVLSMKLPSNVIEVTNTLGGFIASTPPAGADIPVFTAFQGSTETILYGDQNGDPGHIFGNGTFNQGYLIFLDVAGATLAGAWLAVALSDSYMDGNGNTHNRFQCYGSLPWPPTPSVDQFYVSAASPVNLGDEEYYGFPYVPNPENAV